MFPIIGMIAAVTLGFGSGRQASAPSQEALATPTAIARDALIRLNQLHSSGAIVEGRSQLQFDPQSSSKAYEALRSVIAGPAIETAAVVPEGMQIRNDDRIRQCSARGGRDQASCATLAPSTVGFLSTVASGMDANTVVISAVVIQWEAPTPHAQPGFTAYLQYKKVGATWRFDRILRVKAS